MNRWLYRAAGTVGVAGGFLLLATGSAQADQAEPVEEQLGNALAPSSGLPLPGLPALPGLPGLPALPLDGLPLDPLGLRDGKVGVGLPVDTLLRPDSVQLSPLGLPLDPTGPLSDAAGLPPGLLPIEPRTVPAPTDLLQALPIPDDQPRTLPAPADAPMNPSPAPSLPDWFTDDDAPFPGVAESTTVPALIGEQLERERGLSPAELTDTLSRAELTGGLPLIGPALAPVSQLLGVGNLPAQLPVAGGVVGPLTGQLPVVGNPTPIGGGAELHEPRPVVDQDPEYAIPYYRS